MAKNKNFYRLGTDRAICTSLEKNNSNNIYPY